MYILGIHGGTRISQHNAAAALVKDNQILCVIEEERLNTIKTATGNLPYNAMRFCLESQGLSISDIDIIACTGETYEDYEAILRNFIEFRFGFCPPIKLVHHHLAHCHSAFSVSGFEEAMVMSADAVGDRVSTMLAKGKGTKLDVLKTFPGSNSLGYYYNIVTQLLGFRLPEDPYKVMGLASYGKPNVDMDFLLKVGSAGDYTFNSDVMRSFPVAQSAQERIFNAKVEEVYGKTRIYSEPITAQHENLAASAQKRLEEVVVHLVKYMHEETGLRKIALAGGVALNCVANQKIAELDFIDEIFVQPASDDGGLALGCALKVANDHGISFNAISHAYYGCEYGNEEIEETLKQLKVRYERVSDVAQSAAQDLARGQILGWFQGKMEFGPRALGNRSILADARDPEMKDKVNILVKYREEFRPFAPAILEQKAESYFIGCKHSPFMTQTYDVVESKKEIIPSVVHVDGTARVQTVNTNNNDKFFKLISEFDRLTGVPVVLNTSFNIKGQPIVAHPYQAVATFFGTGMDSLYVGDFVVRKNA